MARTRCTIVGIGGGSGSGKTTLSDSIVSAVGRSNVISLSMDAYYKDIDGLSETEVRHYNFDAPEAFDIHALVEHIKALRQGKPIPRFDFDYSTKKRVVTGGDVGPKSVVILEGILVLAVPSIRELLDIKIFVDTPPDLRLIRRARRDIGKHQRTFFDVADQYEETVRPMHAALIEPSKEYSDIVIPFASTNETAVDMLVRGVSTLVARRPARSIEWDKDESIMMLVPEGNFLMGSTDTQITQLAKDYAAEMHWFNDERPAHQVFLSSFYVDKYPVTNQQYEYFIEDTGHPSPETWKDRNFRRPKLPVTGVSFDDALAYAKWAGKRLLTEAEWEKAARGIGGRLYPWGDAPPAGRASFGGNFRGPTEVGRFPDGASPYGVMDMAGNVWEWVGDEYDPSYYLRSERENPKGPKSGRGRSVRGGCWINNPTMLRCAERDFRREPHSDLRYFGFRCAVSLDKVA